MFPCGSGTVCCAALYCGKNSITHLHNTHHFASQYLKFKSSLNLQYCEMHGTYEVQVKEFKNERSLLF